MAEVMFVIAGVFAVGAAVGVVVMRNPFYSVLSLVLHLIALAALFLLLRAQLVAAGQVIVYAGAVMVLYLFVVSYVGGEDAPVSGSGPSLAPLAVLIAVALFVELTIATAGSALAGINSEGAEVSAGFGSPQELGTLLLERFLFVFEVVSFLLFVATVGAIILARRRRGLDEPAEPPGSEPPRKGAGAGVVSPLPQTMADPVLSRPGDPHDAIKPRKGW